MNATLRHWALLAAFAIPFAFAGLALIDAVLLADEPPTVEGIMARGVLYGDWNEVRSCSQLKAM